MIMKHRSEIRPRLLNHRLQPNARLKRDLAKGVNVHDSIQELPHRVQFRRPGLDKPDVTSITSETTPTPRASNIVCQTATFSPRGKDIIFKLGRFFIQSLFRDSDRIFGRPMFSDLDEHFEINHLIASMTRDNSLEAAAQIQH